MQLRVCKMTKKWVVMRTQAFMMSLLRYHSRLSGSRNSGMSLDISGTTRSLKHSLILSLPKISAASRPSNTTWVRLSILWISQLSKRRWSKGSIWMWETGDKISRRCSRIVEFSMKSQVRYFNLQWSWRISILLNWGSTSWLTRGRTSEWLNDLIDFVGTLNYKLTLAYI